MIADQVARVSKLSATVFWTICDDEIQKERQGVFMDGR